MWIEVTSADVKNRLSGAEYNGVTAAALASGQVAATVVAAQITGVVNYIRGFVPAGVPRGDGETIPDELLDAALAMIVYRILTRLPNLKSLLDQSRKDANEAAEKLMRDVAGGRFRLVTPSDPDDAQPAGTGVEQVGTTTRTATRETMRGL